MIYLILYPNHIIFVKINNEYYDPNNYVEVYFPIKLIVICSKSFGSDDLEYKAWLK